MTWTFRPAQPGDLDAVEALMGACVAGMQARRLDQWDAVYPTRAVFEADAAEGTLYLAHSGERLAGAVVLNDREEPEYAAVPWQFAATRIAVVHRLMVDPDAQSRGLGRALMIFAEARAVELGFEVIRLDTFTGNERALALYDALGYRRSGFVTFRKGRFVCFEKRLGAEKT